MIRMRCCRYRPHIIAYSCVSFTLMFFGLLISVMAMFKLDASLAQAWLAGPTTMAVGLVLCGKVVIDCRSKGRMRQDNSMSNVVDYIASQQKTIAPVFDRGNTNCQQLVGVTIENPSLVPETTRIYSPTSAPEVTAPAVDYAASEVPKWNVYFKPPGNVFSSFALSSDATKDTKQPSLRETRKPPQLNIKIPKGVCEYHQSKIGTDVAFRSVQSPVGPLSSKLTGHDPDRIPIVAQRTASLDELSSVQDPHHSTSKLSSASKMVNRLSLELKALKDNIMPTLEPERWPPIMTSTPCYCTESPNKHLCHPKSVETMADMSNMPRIWHLRSGTTYQNRHVTQGSAEQTLHPSARGYGSLFQGETFLLNDKQYMI